jgi:hypothetical protein
VLWGGGTPASAVTLPDGRVYEAVSPVETEGSAAVYVPVPGTDRTGYNSQYGIVTVRPFEVATDGNAVVYAGDPPPEGPGGRIGQSFGDAYLSKRGSGGWRAVDLEPIGTLDAKYKAFSSDLSVGVLQTPSSLQSGGSSGLYYYVTAGGAGGEYQSLHPAMLQSKEEEFWEGARFAGGNAGGSGILVFSHLLFEGLQALLAGEGTLEAELRAAAKGVVEEGKQPSILYDSVDGRLSVVNVLPDGKTDADASFGSSATEKETGSGLGNAISADASRIFWTDGNTGDLYVRERDTSSEAATVQIDVAESGCGSCTGGGGIFWTASHDGSHVLFTDESQLTSDSTAKPGEPNLYEYEVNAEIGKPGVTTDLTAVAGANVRGIVGAGEDDEYIYLVANGVLASNENGNDERAETGKDNLYLYHAGSATFISMLSEEDGGSVIPFEENGSHNTGDWQASLEHRTAEVTPDGRSLVFMSNRKLTGYDNEYSYIPYESREAKTVALYEVFHYEAESNQLRCASCDPSGKGPVATEFDRERPASVRGPLGAYIPVNQVNFYRAQPRVLSADGSRVFFVSGEPLVPQDTNGWLDVYEWEHDGAGSCRQAQGCVYLLSGGAYPENSYLIGADASGENAFFITTAQLVKQDRNDQDDVYDARVGGAQLPSPPVCEGTGCQGIPPAPPIFATPASVTFAGLGNFPPQAALSAKPKKKSEKPRHCARGTVRKHDKCVKRRPHRSDKQANRSTKGRK